MKKIFTKKSITIGTLILCSVTFIAGVPVKDDRTILQEIFSSLPVQKLTPVQQEQSKKSLDEIWPEIEKIAANNGGDSVSMSGILRLYDNNNDKGIKEEEHFSVQRAGNNQYLGLDSFARLQVGHTLLLIDHSEKEIVIENSAAQDSVYTALRLLDPQKFREILQKDGTTAEINIADNGQKVLTIRPGTLDAVNEYNIFYDAVTYSITKICVAYTSTPYQNYLEDNDKDSKDSHDSAETTVAGLNGNEKDSINLNDLDIDITEYTVEFDIQQKQYKCSFNFSDNVFFKMNGSDIPEFKSKLAKYKITNN